MLKFGKDFLKKNILLPNSPHTPSFLGDYQGLLSKTSNLKYYFIFNITILNHDKDTL